MKLAGKQVLITGSARRIGRAMAIAVARAGADVFIHHSSSPEEALQLQQEIHQIGRAAEILQADFEYPEQASSLIERAFRNGPLFALVNNASIFEPLNWKNTDLAAWHRHMDINLTVPFLLSQAFARLLPQENHGRIVNILDWRALRPGADHLAYTISKVGLLGLTRSLAVAFAPNITVNGLAFGAILPPADGGNTTSVLDSVPQRRWAELDEVGDALIFLLSQATYTTGEIIHLDGGRHLI